ncbi:MAG: EFR1 family ferrodoxin [Candidatus Omnitrophica bacterium]|nr:EFR1 family ferrodoxin [Candidatus Omnitrophota bacterium]
MRTVIYYFSGTGNSLDVAQGLAKSFINEDVEIINLSTIHIHEFKILSSDRIGIIFPIYMGRMPIMVSNFLEKLVADKSKYVFAIATYGGLAGDVIQQVKTKLKIRGIKLSAGFLVKMPENFIPFFGAIPEAEQQKLFQRKDRKISQIAHYITKKKKGHFENDFFLINMLYSGFIGKMGQKMIPTADKNFWTTDKCNGCEICCKICPADNIIIRNERPVWKHKCELCLACLQWCPLEAIQYKKSTLKRKRYQNPNINAGNLTTR